MQLELQQSRGLRNDRSRKFIGPEYFYDMANYNYDDIIGCNRINFPEIEYNIGGTDSIDGMFEFRYIDSNSTLQTETIVVVGGNVVKDFLDTPTTIYSGLTANNKCTFAVLNDKLFISNGVDNVLVYDGEFVYEMGAPKAQNLNAAGALTGDYYYAITYTVDGVELVTGAVSNTVTVNSNTITVTLPVGPTGTTSRDLYRTEAGGTDLYHCHNVNDNTTSTFVDNVGDNNLGAAVPAVNSEAPKPKFITVKDERLVGVGVSRRPNYLYYSETEIESLFATIGVTDVSGVGNDNTGLTGMAIDYNEIVVFSEKRIYIVDVSGEAASVRQTNSNIGCIDGHSIAKVPPQAQFDGGLMFVSTEYDIRIFNGNLKVNLATSFDNLTTENFSAQLNKNEMKLKMTGEKLHGFFYDYKYHLIIDDEIYVYDIRILGWGRYFIVTESYSPKWNVFAELNGKFYIGQKDTGIVEEMYRSLQYRSENVNSFFETGELLVDDNYKLWKYLNVYYSNTGNVVQNVIITPDNNSNLSQTINFRYSADGFDTTDFDPTYFQGATGTDDYKLIHINQYARWLRLRFQCASKFNFRGYKLEIEGLSNKE